MADYCQRREKVHRLFTQHLFFATDFSLTSIFLLKYFFPSCRSSDTIIKSDTEFDIEFCIRFGIDFDIEFNSEFDIGL